MKIRVTIEQQHYQIDLDSGRSLAIAQQFQHETQPTAPASQQPNHFGAPLATQQPLEAGAFIGDTTQGGSCNVSSLTLTPHCNGTHTESIAHIRAWHHFPDACLTTPFQPATLITLRPTPAAHTPDHYHPPPNRR